MTEVQSDPAGLPPIDWHRIRNRISETPDYAALASCADERRFLETLFLYLGRNLAVAVAFLEPQQREEGMLAYLCCRVLDAYEDMEPDPQRSACQIESAANFLMGHGKYQPEPLSQQQQRATERLECMLANRIHWLQAALQTLPPSGQSRIFRLLATLANTMAASRRAGVYGGRGDIDQYGRDVLGSCIEYAFQLVGVVLPVALDVQEIGVVLQCLNHYRDHQDDLSVQQLSDDEHLDLLNVFLVLIESAVTVPLTLSLVDLDRKPEVRAAVSYMVATSLRFVYRKLQLKAPFLVDKAYACALLARSSNRVYLYQLSEIDNVLLQLVDGYLSVYAGAGTYTPKRIHYTSTKASRKQELFEMSIADLHPAASSAALLKRYIRLSHFSLAILNQLPQERISEVSGSHSEGLRIMISDYLMASAVAGGCQLGARNLALFSRVGAKLIEAIELGQTIDAQGLTAEAITRCVCEAQGLELRETERLVGRNRAQSIRLYGQRVQHHRLLSLIFSGLYRSIGYWRAARAVMKGQLYPERNPI